MILAVLKALEQVGDKSSLPAVERLQKTTQSEEIRQAAEACVRYLELHLQRNEQSQSLLRPAQPEEARPETLLRPAQHVGSDSSDLLRSHALEGESAPIATEIEPPQQSVLRAKKG